MAVLRGRVLCMLQSENGQRIRLVGLALGPEFFVMLLLCAFLLREEMGNAWRREPTVRTSFALEMT